MRNPWVHDDVPTTAGPGHGGRIRLLGGFVWGVLLLGVGGTALLISTGAIEPGLAPSLRSAVTLVVAGAMSVLAVPLILRLLAVSRFLATVAFVAGGWLLGGFVWNREAERIERLLPDGFGVGADGVNGLIGLLDALLSVL
jgi:hypothetical protein